MTMKKLTLLLACILHFASSYAQDINITTYRDFTQAEAVQYIKTTYYANQDVDFYVMTTGNVQLSSDSWYVFVDEEPLLSWGHSCASYRVKKVQCPMALWMFPFETYTLPPTDQYTISPYSIQDRDFVGGDDLQIDVSPTSNPVASKTYAVIMNSEANGPSHYERCWNNCSLMYQLLVNEYHVPKANIVVFSPRTPMGIANMVKADGSGMAVAPLDMDRDGTDDNVITLSDTNSWYWQYYLNQIVPQDAHLMIYFTGTSGIGANGEPYLYQYDDNKFYASTIAGYLDNLNARYVSVILDVNDAESFIPYFEGHNRVVTASTATGGTTGCQANFPCNQFSYEWALAMQNFSLNFLTPDSDGNGYVSTEEASRCVVGASGMQTQYSSPLLSVGEDLALNHHPLPVDLYARDNAADTGKEPNTSTTNGLSSPSIWVRETDDGQQNQFGSTITVDQVGQRVYIYVKVENRGVDDYPGYGKAVTILYNNQDDMTPVSAFLNPSYSESVGTVPLDSVITSGSSKIFYASWDIPTYVYDGSVTSPHAVVAPITAIIHDTDDDPDSIIDILGKKNQARMVLPILIGYGINSISSVSYDSSSSRLIVSFSVPAAENTSVRVSTTQPYVNSQEYAVAEGAEHLEVELDPQQHGMIIINLLEEGAELDSRKISQ